MLDSAGVRESGLSVFGDMKCIANTIRRRRFDALRAEVVFGVSLRCFVFITPDVACLIPTTI